MKMIFVIINILFAIGEINGENFQNYWIESLANTSGLYQEHIGSLHFTSNSWRVDIKINLTDFKNDVDSLKRSINNTKSMCKVNSNGCEMVINELSHRERQLENKITELYLIMHPRIRLKRDILDKVGTIGNVLFGLMDARDSEKIYKALDNINSDNTAIFEDLAEHHTVINSVIRAFNLSANETNTNFKNIKSMLFEMGKEINENTKEIYLTEIQTILFSNIFQLEQKISNLIEIVQKAHDGTISGKLFRLPKFSEALGRLHRATLQDIRLPFDLESLHLRQLNGVADIEGHYLEDDVILSVTFPLTEQTLNLYKLTSIPLRITLETYAILDNPYPYMASVENGHSEVMLLRKGQLDKCNLLDKMNYICRHSVATYTDKSKNCIRRLLSGQVDHSICNVKGFKSRGELWESLASDNKWLFVIPKTAQLQISCPKERSTTELRGIGILHLKPLCRAFTSEVQLTTVTRAKDHVSVSISLDTNVLSNYNFSGLMDIEIEKKGMGHVDLQTVGSKVPLLPIANSTYIRKHTEEKLYQQSQQIRLYESLMLGAAIGIVLLIALYVCYRQRLALWRVCFVKNKRSQTEPIELENRLPRSTSTTDII